MSGAGVAADGQEDCPSVHRDLESTFDLAGRDGMEVEKSLDKSEEEDFLAGRDGMEVEKSLDKSEEEDSEMRIEEEDDGDHHISSQNSIKGSSSEQQPSNSGNDHCCSDEGTTESPDQCYYCKESLHNLLDFGSFKSCRPCMKLSTEKSDKEKASFTPSGSSENDIIGGSVGEGSLASDSEMDEGSEEDEEVEDDDDEDEEDEIEREDEAVNERDDTKEDDESEAEEEVEAGYSFAPHPDLQLVLQTMSKRPQSFDAISVFQEPITYTIFKPFDNIQPMDTKRWMLYRNPLVNPDPYAIYYHYKVFAAAWYTRKSYAIAMQTYRELKNPESSFILVGVLRTTCPRPETHLLGFVNDKIQIILPDKYRTYEKVQLCIETYSKYHWYVKTGDNCIKWLMENYYISYKDYVGTQVYAKIKNAFDAMVKELLWPYDKKRKISQDAKFILAEIRKRELEEQDSSQSKKRKCRTDIRTTFEPAANEEKNASILSRPTTRSTAKSAAKPRNSMANFSTPQLSASTTITRGRRASRPLDASAPSEASSSTADDSIPDEDTGAQRKARRAAKGRPPAKKPSTSRQSAASGKAPAANRRGQTAASGGAPPAANRRAQSAANGRDPEANITAGRGPPASTRSALPLLHEVPAGTDATDTPTVHPRPSATAAAHDADRQQNVAPSVVGQASIEQNEIALLRESLAAMEKENACLRRSINTPALSNGTELASVSMIDQNLRDDFQVHATTDTKTVVALVTNRLRELSRVQELQQQLADSKRQLVDAQVKLREKDTDSMTVQAGKDVLELLSQLRRL